MRSTLLILCLMAASSFAQNDARPTDGGTVILDGSLLYTSLYGGNTGGRQHSLLQASPTVGLFAFDHVMIGVTSFLQFESRYLEWPGEEQLLAGPVVGFYADPGAGRGRIAGSFLPFFRAFFVYGSTLGDINHAVSKYGGEAGVTIMVSSTMGLEFLGRYSRDWMSNWNEQWRWGWPPPILKDATGELYSFGIGFTAFL